MGNRAVSCLLEKTVELPQCSVKCEKDYTSMKMRLFLVNNST